MWKNVSQIFFYTSNEPKSMLVARNPGDCRDNQNHFLQQRYQVLQSGKNSTISSGSGDVNSSETPVTGCVNASR